MKLVEGRSGQSVAQHRAEQQGHLGSDWRKPTRHLSRHSNDVHIGNYLCQMKTLRPEVVMEVCRCIHGRIDLSILQLLGRLLFLLVADVPTLGRRVEAMTQHGSKLVSMGKRTLLPSISR